MKILVISMAGIGDTILATPLLRELRANFPKARIEVLVLWAGSRDILVGNPHIDAIHQRNFFTSSTIENLKFLFGLRRQGFDISINTHPQSRIHYRGIARLIGARIRLSHTYESWTPLDRLLVNRTLPQNYNLHTVDQNLQIVPLLEGKITVPQPNLEVFLESGDLGWAEAFSKANGFPNRTVLGVHVGSGGTKNLRFKRWPLTAYGELLKKALDRWPELTVLLFGGPDEASDIAWLMQHLDSRHVLRADTKSLKQAAALMKHCRVFLSVDTALMHLAAAMKTPQVVIEAPTLNKTNEPFRNTYFLAANPAVGGRNLEYYRYDGRGIRGSDTQLRELMESVRAETVMDALERSLA